MIVDGSGYMWTLTYDVGFQVAGTDTTSSSPGHTSAVVDVGNSSISITNATSGHGLPLYATRSYYAVALYSNRSLVCKYGAPKLATTAGSKQPCALRIATGGYTPGTLASDASVDLTMENANVTSTAASSYSIDEIPEADGPDFVQQLRHPSNIVIAVSGTGPDLLKFCATNVDGTPLFILASSAPYVCSDIGFAG